jgi:uncharacterized protein (DUF2336 family)
MNGLTRRPESDMSSVQPENGLLERRIITADSFRALKLKLAAPGRPISPDSPLAAGSPLPPPESEAPDPAQLAAVLPPVSDIPILFAAEDIDPSAYWMEDAAEERPSDAADKSGSDWPSAVLPPQPDFVERRTLERQQPENAEAGMRAHALLDIMAIPTAGSLPQERALANDTLLRLMPRMPLKSLRHLAERVCLMESPSQMLVRRLISHPSIEVCGPLLEHAMIVDDGNLIALAHHRNPAKLKLIARRRIISPALSEALIRSNDLATLVNLVRNQGASFSIESMWNLSRFATVHPALQAPLVTRADTPSPIVFHLFWRLPSELRRYVLSRFLTDSETISRILTMNRENDGGGERKQADLSLLAKLADAAPDEAGEIYAKLTQVSAQTGTRIAEDAGGEALTVALKAAGLTRSQFADIVAKRTDAEALQSIFDTLSFNKARVLLTYWDWAVKRTGPYARVAS